MAVKPDDLVFQALGQDYLSLLNNLGFKTGSPVPGRFQIDGSIRCFKFLGDFAVLTVTSSPFLFIDVILQSPFYRSFLERLVVEFVFFP